MIQIEKELNQAAVKAKEALEAAQKAKDAAAVKAKEPLEAAQKAKDPAAVKAKEALEAAYITREMHWNATVVVHMKWTQDIKNKRNQL